MLMFMIIFCSIAGICGILECVDCGKKKKERLLYVIVTAILFFCIGIYVETYIDSPDTSNVAPELIYSVSEFENAKEDGASMYDIEYILSRATAAEMEISDALHMIDPDITEEEAAAIIKYSDTLQNKKDN